MKIREHVYFEGQKTKTLGIRLHRCIYMRVNMVKLAHKVAWVRIKGDLNARLFLYVYPKGTFPKLKNI